MLFDFIFFTYFPSILVLNFIFLELIFMLAIIFKNIFVPTLLSIFYLLYIFNFCYKSAKKLKENEEEIPINLIMAGG